jgi:thiol-disulfide isomerase/thioredoxin
MAFGFAAAATTATGQANSPTPEQALTLTPIQQDIDYDRPSDADSRKCSIRPERVGTTVAWVIRGPEGKMLRRFADTNADNVVDQWSYYKDGLEIYRDIDANFNGKADQYRWFQTAGTRWGMDENEDGQIDRWRVLSTQELAEEAVVALQSKNLARFKLLLPTQEELAALGLGNAMSQRIATTVRDAPEAFRKLAADQKVINAQSKFVDFGAGRPAMVPAGTDNSRNDVVLYDNTSALVDTAGKHEQVFLGTLVAVDKCWKLVDVPTFDNTGQPTASSLLLSSSSGSGASSDDREGAPSASMQALMAELATLDEQAELLSVEKQGPITEKRAEILEKLAEVTTDVELRDQWFRQLADMISAAVQTGSYSKGIDQLTELEDKLADEGVDQELLAHVTFRRMWAEYGMSQQAPSADYSKIQEKWLVDLREFADKFPETQDAAEALLQLGMSQEFAGNIDDAKKSYRLLVSDYPDSQPRRKAAGAVRRLESIGKPITLQGKGYRGESFNLSQVRGKLVLVQYWATWAEPSIDHMNSLKELHSKYAPRGFEIVSVCLDNSPQQAAKIVSDNRFLWKQVYAEGGLDGRLADEMGVMTLPLMLLVDKQGNVLNNNIQMEELDKELKRL